MMFEALLTKRGIYLMMALWILALGLFPSHAFSMPVPSKSLAEHQLGSREADMKIIDEFLAKETVTRKLKQLGLKEEEIAARLRTLSDRQLRLLASKAETIKSGAGAGAIALIVVFIVLVIIAVLYFTGYAVKVEPKYKE